MVILKKFFSVIMSVLILCIGLTASVLAADNLSPDPSTIVSKSVVVCTNFKSNSEVGGTVSAVVTKVGAKVAAVALTNITTTQAGEYTVTFTAKANAGYSFDGWYSDSGFNSLVSTSSVYTEKYDETSVLYASFVKYGTAVNCTNDRINSEFGGSITTSKNADHSVTYTAVANENFYFTGWYSDSAFTNLVTTNTSYTIQPGDSRVLYARYVSKNNVVIVTDNDNQNSKGGTVTVDSSSSDKIVMTAKAESGYAFKGWYSDAGYKNLVSTNNKLELKKGDSTIYYALFESTDKPANAGTSTQASSQTPTSPNTSDKTVIYIAIAALIVVLIGAGTFFAVSAKKHQ